ncbi:hypothetical protein ES703_102038 [subsurface metagenome]
MKKPKKNIIKFGTSDMFKKTDNVTNIYLTKARCSWPKKSHLDTVLIASMVKISLN